MDIKILQSLIARNRVELSCYNYHMLDNKDYIKVIKEVKAIDTDDMSDTFQKMIDETYKEMYKNKQQIKKLVIIQKALKKEISIEIGMSNLARVIARINEDE